MSDDVFRLLKLPIIIRLHVISLETMMLTVPLKTSRGVFQAGESACWVLLLFTSCLSSADAFVRTDSRIVPHRFGTSTSQSIGIFAKKETEFGTSKLTFLYNQASGDLDVEDFNKGNIQQNADPSTLRYNHTSSNFCTGNELKTLRADLNNLRENLKWAEAMKDEARIMNLQSAIEDGEKLDPDKVYSKALQMIEETNASKELAESEKQTLLDTWKVKAQDARAVLPRFQLDGLWVGNYGENGNELVNVTYAGDTLVATKVTGDASVPRGQVSFTVDLTPKNNDKSLDPIKLSFDKAATAATELPRYSGKGQIAKPGFIEARFVEGQMVLFERHFSFVWIPTRHHVLFRRPSPEQILSLLRDTISKEDELCIMREHIARCFTMDLTESLARQYAGDHRTEPFRRISLQEELEALDKAEQGKKDATGGPRFKFWNLYQYIDGFLRDDGRKNAHKKKKSGPETHYYGEGI